MPARRLFDNAQTIQPYDVLTQTDGASDLMVHALLFHDTEPRSGVTRSTTLRVFHMGPPLGLRRDTVDAVGSANLTPKQRRQVKAFMDDRLLEKKAQESRQRALGSESEKVTIGPWRW